VIPAGDQDPDAPITWVQVERRWFIGYLLCLLCLLNFLASITAPRVLEPALEVPPNRYFHPSKAIMFIAAVAFGYEKVRWVLLPLAATAMWLAWRSRFDRFIRALVIIEMVSCLAILGCILHAESLPAWVGNTYGSDIRERVFEGKEYHLLPTRWQR